MIPPRKLKLAVRKNEKENMRFRTFLKGNADEEELDAQFLKLHNELFQNYDCSRCRNCCKEYHGEIQDTEIQRASAYLHMEADEFICTYLKIDPEDKDKYMTKNKPCNFLQKDGSCMLEGCKPENCAAYPYTNQPERMGSLLNMLYIIEVCPVAYEIWEQLKKIYNFK